MELEVQNNMTSCKRLSGYYCFHLSFAKYPWASLVGQRLKRLPAMWETWVQSLGWEDPLEKEMATHSSILAWRIPWGSLVGYSPWGGKESDTTERLRFRFAIGQCRWPPGLFLAPTSGVYAFCLSTRGSFLTKVHTAPSFPTS